MWKTRGEGVCTWTHRTEVLSKRILRLFEGHRDALHTQFIAVIAGGGSPQGQQHQVQCLNVAGAKLVSYSRAVMVPQLASHRTEAEISCYELFN